MTDKNTNPDYIDVSDFKKLVISVLRSFFKLAAFTSLVIKKGLALLVTGIICGILLGFLYYVSIPQYYKVSMVVQSTSDISKTTYADILEQLDKLKSTREKLATEMHISLDLAKKITFIDSRNFEDQPLSKDTTESKPRQFFKIVVGLNSNTYSDSLEDAILNYLNQNPYLKNSKETQLLIYQDKLSFVESELSKLDSLKSEYLHYLATPKVSATFYYNTFDPASIYKQSSDLATQKALLTERLALDKKPVLLINGFKTSNRPTSVSAPEATILGALFGLIIAFFFSFFREAGKKLKSYSTRNS